MDAVITQSSANLANLDKLVLSYASMKSAGYVVAPLDVAALRKKAKCITCGKNSNSRVKPPKTDNKEEAQSDAGAAASKDALPPDEECGSESVVDIGSLQLEDGEIEETAEQNASEAKKGKGKDKPPIDQCCWHPQRFYHGRFQCCGKNGASPGCHSQPSHIPEPITIPSFTQRWTFYGTPKPPPNTTPRKAVALDCEMGTSVKGESVLIRLSLIDYFTNEVLVNSLVWPNEPLQHCNTRWSGIRMHDLRQANARGDALRGRDKARTQICRFVGPETIVVVHGGQGDLTVLRWIHFRVVDTAETERRRRVRVEGNALSLKRLCELRLGLLVQQHGAHCSLEDARAARVLAWFYAENKEEDEPATENKANKGGPENWAGPEIVF